MKRHKNDATDAGAICEAVARPNMRFFATKTPEQRSCLTLHRARHLFIRQQTSVINVIRAHLAEFGIVAPVGRNGVEQLLLSNLVKPHWVCTFRIGLPEGPSCFKSKILWNPIEIMSRVWRLFLEHCRKTWRPAMRVLFFVLSILVATVGIGARAEAQNYP